MSKEAGPIGLEIVHVVRIPTLHSIRIPDP